jgi:periplasmic protein TonB
MQATLLVLASALWLDSSMHAPRILQKVPAEYTPEARNARHEGSVLVDVIVGTDGSVRGATIRRPLGLGLDDKALAAVSRWKFTPATLKRDSTPLEVKVTISVDFRLK